jgi:hypothetical protein
MLALGMRLAESPRDLTRIQTLFLEEVAPLLGIEGEGGSPSSPRSASEELRRRVEERRTGGA